MNAHESAYPQQPTDVFGRPAGRSTSGLTKREAFAMAAMQGVLANDPNGSEDAAQVATWAREYADALLAELANVQP